MHVCSVERFSNVKINISETEPDVCVFCAEGLKVISGLVEIPARISPPPPSWKLPPAAGGSSDRTSRLKLCCCTQTDIKWRPASVSLVLIAAQTIDSPRCVGTRLRHDVLRWPHILFSHFLLNGPVWDGPVRRSVALLSRVSADTLRILLRQDKIADYMRCPTDDLLTDRKTGDIGKMRLHR